VTLGASADVIVRHLYSAGLDLTGSARVNIIAFTPSRRLRAARLMSPLQKAR
jgi:hypothetical protein